MLRPIDERLREEMLRVGLRCQGAHPILLLVVLLHHLVVKWIELLELLKRLKHGGSFLGQREEHSLSLFFLVVRNH